MTIKFTNGDSIEIEEKLGETLKDKFTDASGRSGSSKFIEVTDNGKLVFVLNKECVMYIR